MLSCNSMALDVLLILDTSNFKNGKHAFKMPDQQFPSIRIPQYHDMSKIQSFCMFIDFLKLHIPSGIIGNIVKDHHKFPKKVIDLNWRFKLCGDQDFDRPIIFKYIVELIKHRLIIFLYILLSSLLLVLNSDWLLSFLLRQFLPFFSFLHFYLILDSPSLEIDLYSFFLVFDLIRLLFESSTELFHSFRPRFLQFVLFFASLFILMRRVLRLFDLFGHCCFYYKQQRRRSLFGVGIN